jgi:methyltransferase (TIGR00027 family)
MGPWEPLAGVERTAPGMAYVRAQESRRPDRLFDDPYAQAFADAAPGSAAAGAAFAWHAVIRTRFFDDYLTAACRAGCRQAVLLAAGLDAWAFRSYWPPAGS